MSAKRGTRESRINQTVSSALCSLSPLLCISVRDDDVEEFSLALRMRAMKGYFVVGGLSLEQQITHLCSLHVGFMTSWAAAVNAVNNAAPAGIPDVPWARMRLFLLQGDIAARWIKDKKAAVLVLLGFEVMRQERALRSVLFSGEWMRRVGALIPA